MASNVLVKDIMSKDVKVVNNNTSVQEVVATMNKFDKDAILVVQSGKPTGIITVKDVLIRAVEAGTPLRTIIARMVYTNPLVVIDENATRRRSREADEALDDQALTSRRQTRCTRRLTRR